MKSRRAKPKSDEKEFNEDEVAALLNKEKASGGGAKRSTDEAALGGEKNNGGQKLSQSEMDALRGQLERLLEHAGRRTRTPKTCASRSGSSSTPTGKLEGTPEVVEAASGNRQFDEQRRCAPSQKCDAHARRTICLPKNTKSGPTSIVNFDPSEMF